MKIKQMTEAELKAKSMCFINRWEELSKFLSPDEVLTVMGNYLKEVRALGTVKIYVKGLEKPMTYDRTDEELIKGVIRYIEGKGGDYTRAIRELA